MSTLIQSNFIQPYINETVDWQPSTDYTVRQMILRNNELYICLSSHTSTISFVADYFTSNKWKSMGAMIGEVRTLDTAIIPNGWLPFNGTWYDKTAYPDLYAVVGNIHGSTTTQFKVGTSGGRVLVGSGQASFSTSFLGTDVNVSTNAITILANTTLQTGRAVLYTCVGTPPTGLVNNTTYYIIVNSMSSICLASTLANAIAMVSVPIDITAQGSGTSTISFAGTTRVLGEFGGEDSHTDTQLEMPIHNHPFVDYANGTRAEWQTGSENCPYPGTYNRNTSNVGGSIAHNNMMNYIVVNQIIKY